MSRIHFRYHNKQIIENRMRHSHLLGSLPFAREERINPRKIPQTPLSGIGTIVSEKDFPSFLKMRWKRKKALLAGARPFLKNIQSRTILLRLQTYLFPHRTKDIPNPREYLQKLFRAEFHYRDLLLPDHKHNRMDHKHIFSDSFKCKFF